MSELEKLEQRIVSLFEENNHNMNHRFDAMDQRFDAIDGRLDAMDGRLDAIDGRLDAMDGRLGAMDGRLDAMDGRLDAMDGRLDTMDRRFDSMDQRFEGIEIDIKMIRIEMQEESNRIKDIIHNEVQRLDERIHNLEVSDREKWNVPELRDRMDMLEVIVAGHTDQIKALRKDKMTELSGQ